MGQSNRERPRVRRGCALAAAVALALLVTLCTLGDPHWSSAHHLPPVYPGAVVVGHELVGSSGGSRETTTYAAQANLATVLAFVERSMPGFERDGRDTFANTVCDTNPLADLQTWVLVSEPFGRCADVRIWRDPERPDWTLLRYRVQWAAG